MAIKVLMYGWEFPPRISGGLGTACYAIVKELARRNVELTLVLPQTANVAGIEHVNLISCDHAVALDEDEFEGMVNIKYPAVAAYLCPYISTKDFKRFLSNETLQDFFALLASMHLPEELKAMAIATTEAQMLGAKITGKYGINLLREVFRYALIAGAFAKDVEHDVIHAHDWLTMLAALEARRYSHKPVVLHIHALETDRSGMWIDKRIFAIEKYGMDQADRIIAVSQYTKNNIVQYYGISSDKITVIHNGIYYNESLPDTNTTHPKMVLFLGRITQQKGPHFFLEVARLILEKRNDVQFVLAGAGDLLLETIERTANLRIGKNVHFTGFLDNDRVKEIYQLADVYVMPSVSEPFGLSALEALSYGVPVVIAKQSGVAEVLHHSLVSDFWDTEDIAAKILALLEYPALRRTSVANEQQGLHAVTWGKAAEKIIELYKKLF
jgi:glycosyltransferase involved in cell wall biosynthesis